MLQSDVSNKSATDSSNTLVKSSRLANRFLAAFAASMPTDLSFQSTEGHLIGAHKAIVNAASDTLEKMVNGTDGGLDAVEIIKLKHCNSMEFEQVGRNDCSLLKKPYNYPVLYISCRLRTTCTTRMSI